MPISDKRAPTLRIGQIIKVLMLENISSIHSTCIDDFSAIRIESFIVNFSLELIKFDISTCALKRGIRVFIKKKLYQFFPFPCLSSYKTIELRAYKGAKYFITGKQTVHSRLSWCIWWSTTQYNREWRQTKSGISSGFVLLKQQRCSDACSNTVGT